MFYTAKTQLRYAHAPWGMQPNTSLWRFQHAYTWAAFHSCLYAAYYTISGVPETSPRRFYRAPTNITITVIPPTTQYNPNSLFPTAAATHRQMSSPHTNAYRLRPYVAIMFINIRRFGDIGNQFIRSPLYWPGRNPLANPVCLQQRNHNLRILFVCVKMLSAHFYPFHAFTYSPYIHYNLFR